MTLTGKYTLQAIRDSHVPSDKSCMLPPPAASSSEQLKAIQIHTYIMKKTMNGHSLGIADAIAMPCLLVCV